MIEIKLLLAFMFGFGTGIVIFKKYENKKNEVAKRAYYTAKVHSFVEHSGKVHGKRSG